MFNQPVVAALNHLLIGSGWALPRLAKFKGRTARFNIAPFSFACTVLDDGTLLSASSDASADAVCTIVPSLVPRLVLQEEKALDEIETSGDAILIEEIFFLIRNLRWDAAEDLSRVAGDIAAERIMQLARAGQQQVRDTVLNMSQTLSEYWTEERPLIAKPLQITDFARGVNAFQEKLAQLEQRIDRLLNKNK